jgi:serine/threonine protein kinase/Flp pilus assembly protein TadD
MASNYPSDPKQALSVGNSASPQSEPGGSAFAAQNANGVYSSAQTPRAGQLRLVPGTILSSGRYRIEKLIAAGGMGAVYRTMDTRFNRPCAVKEMLDEFRSESERTQAVEWFSREATLLLDLNHPCIPRVRDFFAENGRNYLVMDFIDGRTLAEVIDREGNVIGVNGARGIAEARARSWAQQVCSVLSYLHRQTPPVIFRDLKPSNIMVTEREEIKLIDFGIARPFQSQTQSTIIMTPGYAPPEQLYGRAEPRSDIYALGATLHKILTRHDAANNQPGIFSFPSVRSLRPDISPAFDQVVIKALNPDVEQRWSSASEMERVLMALPPITVVPPVGSVSPQPSQGVPSSSQSGAAGPLLHMPYGITPGAIPGTASASVAVGKTGPAGPQIAAAQAQLAAVPPRIEAAYEATKIAYGLEPNNPLVHKLFGLVFARRVPSEPDRALQAYNRSLQLNPEDAETHKLVGDLSLYLYQQPSQGIAPYIQSLRLNPNDFETHQRLAFCYEKANQLESALHEYQEAVRLAPKNASALLTLGQLAMRMQRFSVAEQALVQSLFINPGDHQTRFLLSQVYEQENKLEEAFRECGYVVGPLSNNPAVQQMYQRLRTRLGR